MRVRGSWFSTGTSLPGRFYPTQSHRAGWDLTHVPATGSRLILRATQLETKGEDEEDDREEAKYSRYQACRDRIKDHFAYPKPVRCNRSAHGCAYQNPGPDRPSCGSVCKQHASKASAMVRRSVRLVRMCNYLRAADVSFMMILSRGRPIFRHRTPVYRRSYPITSVMSVGLPRR